MDRLACHWLQDRGDLPSYESQLYSRMKYGDPVATWRIANAVRERLFGHPLWQVWSENGQKVVMASSAYGSVPTAAHWVSENLQTMLKEDGLGVTRMKFEREGGFGCHSYSQMDLAKRREVLQERRIWLEGPELAEGATLLVFDDLRSTGAHEESLRKVVEDHPAISRVVFLYFIGFSSALSKSQPQQEDALNHSLVRTPEDLLQMTRSSQSPLLINARLVRFLLRAGAQDPDGFVALLPKLPEDFLRAVLLAANSRDGYANQAAYVKGFELLQSYLTVASL